MRPGLYFEQTKHDLYFLFTFYYSVFSVCLFGSLFLAIYLFIYLKVDFPMLYRCIHLLKLCWIPWYYFQTSLSFSKMKVGVPALLGILLFYFLLLVNLFLSLEASNLVTSKLFKLRNSCSLWQFSIWHLRWASSVSLACTRLLLHIIRLL